MLLPAFLLYTLLALAVWNDVLTRRIPNLLVLTGMLLGLLLNSIFPAGAGLFSAPGGAIGFLVALEGAALGMAMLLPLYAFGAMGAGDVKLMAMVGAFLGPEQIFGTAMLTLLSGGVLALVVSIWTGTLLKMIRNTYALLLHMFARGLMGDGVRIDQPAAPTGKLAYAIAIMSGTVLNTFLNKAYA
jgi:prepilin peptidase CpaA